MKLFIMLPENIISNIHFDSIRQLFNTMGHNVYFIKESDYDFTGDITYDFSSDGETKWPCINSKIDLNSSYLPNRCNQINIDTPIFATIETMKKIINKLM